MSMDTLFGVDVTPRTTDEWYSPTWIFKAAAVTFDMDVCAPSDPMHRTVPALRYLTAQDDGLTTEWEGLVWMNPPYSNADPWVDRWARHGNGLALLPALPEVHWGGRLMNAAEAITLLSCEFARPDGTKARLRWPLILAGAGDGARLVPPIARADLYSAGAYHVMGVAQ